MYQFFKFFSLSLLVLILVVGNANAKEAGVVRQVNDSAITAADVEERASLMIKASGLRDDAASRDAIRERVLETLTDERLIEQEAKRLKIETEPNDLENAYRTVAGRNNMSVDDFKKFMNSKGVNMATLEQQIKSQLLWSKIVATQIQPNITVSEKEVKDNKLSIEKRVKIANEIAELELSEIVFYINNQNDFNKKMELAKRLVSNIKEGAEFASIARQFSQGFSAKSGGSIGRILSNQMNPMLAKQLIAVKPGNISDPIVLDDGIHIFKVLNKKIVNEQEAQITDEEIKEIVLNKKIEVAVKAYLKRLRMAAHIK